MKNNTPAQKPADMTPSADTPPPVDARALMQGRREIVLVLDGEAYRLRITMNDKLILTQ
jgi:hemin uptake protein HemP